MSAIWCGKVRICRLSQLDYRRVIPLSSVQWNLNRREPMRLYATASTEAIDDNSNGKKKKKKSVPIAQLTEATAREELIELNKAINKHDTLYYDDNSPEITDSMYDKLIIRVEGITGKYLHLKSLIDKNNRIGSGKRSNKLLSFAHTRPMLSLENAFTKEGITNFITKINEMYNTYERNSPENNKKVEMVVEPKIDGLSCSLHYHNGILAKAGTRGDGNIGEDVTENIMALTNIPKSLIFDGDVPAFVEIRGEVYISKEDFNSINQAKADANEQLLSTSRNAAAGCLRRSNNTLLARKALNFCAYYISVNGSDHRSQSNDLTVLKRLGFGIPEPHYVSSDMDELVNYLSRVESMRSDIKYEIDGCVLKVSDQMIQAIVGERSKDPKWAIAYKFNAIEAITTLLSIDIQVGRTGLLTPVANVEPVQVGGVVINRASLHNEDEINRLGLSIGKKVRIKRAGDVIPKIIGLADDVHASTGHSYEVVAKFALPTHCPVCNSTVERDTDSILSRCSGGPLVCPAQAIEGLTHFCSRDAMDIEGFGPAKIEELYNLGVIKTPLDIFQLRSVDLSSSILRDRKGWGDKSVNNLLSAIDSRRQDIPFARFLYALGVRHVGMETAKDISKEFQSFQLFWDYLKDINDAAVASRLLVIKGVGKKAVNSLLKIVHDTRSREVIEGLMGSVLISSSSSSAEEAIGFDSRFPLRGQHFVVTGKLTDKIKLSRSQLYNILEEHGANTSPTVTKSTTILVAAGTIESDSKKLKSAREMRIKILNEDDLLQYFTDNNIKFYSLRFAVFRRF